MFMPRMDALLADPPNPSALSIGTIVIVLGFTTPSSFLRPLGLVLMAGCVQLAMRANQTTDENNNAIHMSIFVGSTTSMLMQYLDSVLLSRWLYVTRGPTSALGGQKILRTPTSASQRKMNPIPGALSSRLKFGWEEAFRSRSAHTPWQINHVPKFFPDRPGMIPTKMQFLYRMVKEFLLSVLFLDVISFRGRDVSMNSVYFASSQIPFFTRLRDVTVEEVILRLFASLMHWLVMYDGAAIMVIALGLGRIERWPPLFNAWTECWSVRQFWGKD